MEVEVKAYPFVKKPDIADNPQHGPYSECCDRWMASDGRFELRTGLIVD